MLAAVRLLLKETKTGGVAAPVERLAAELGKSVDELLGALTASGLRVPEKAREKPVFVEHAGEIFWLNLNGKGELWLNAKASKYSSDDRDGSGGHKGRRPRPKKKEPGMAMCLRKPRPGFRQRNLHPRPRLQHPPPKRRLRAEFRVRPGRSQFGLLRLAITASASREMTGAVFSHERHASVTLRPRTSGTAR